MGPECADQQAALGPYDVRDGQRLSGRAEFFGVRRS
jgi:hypothetical protein